MAAPFAPFGDPEASGGLGDLNLKLFALAIHLAILEGNATTREGPSGFGDGGLPDITEETGASSSSISKSGRDPREDMDVGCF